MALFLLILTTILWGSSFIITKIVTKNVPIFFYLGIRFTFSLLGLIPFLFLVKKIDKKILIMGGITGIIFFIGILFQTYGIQGTTAGKTGFVTSLSTVMVPFIIGIKTRQRLKVKIWIAVLLSVIGMALLLLEGESGLILADFLNLICAFFFSIYIVLNDKYVKLVDVYLYTTIQLGLVSLLSIGCSLLFQESWELTSHDLNFWYLMIYLGVGVVALSFIFQNWSQKHVSPVQTAIVFTLEPVFGLLFGMWLGNETISILGGIGCGLILSAIFISSFKDHESDLARKQMEGLGANQEEQQVFTSENKM